VQQTIEPRTAEAQAGERAVLFVGVAHFVWAFYLGYVWSWGA